jgi:nucleoside 2-deoxyribosyltransferase
MNGLTWREALEWRSQVERELGHQWKLINPVRAQISDDKLDELIGSQVRNEDVRVDLHLTATGIVTQDEFFVDQSDWILANFLGATRTSIGSVWELGYGWGTGKKILSVLEPGDPFHDHPFVRRRSHIFTDNLEDAIDFFHHIAV